MQKVKKLNRSKELVVGQGQKLSGNSNYMDQIRIFLGGDFIVTEEGYSYEWMPGATLKVAWLFSLCSPVNYSLF